MEAAFLIAAVLVAGLTCPAMMWWQRHRGRQAQRCAPASTDRDTELDELRQGQAVLSARLAELQNEPGTDHA